METLKSEILNKEISRVGLGTWAIGGAMWGGTDETAVVRHYSIRPGKRNNTDRYCTGIRLSENLKNL